MRSRTATWFETKVRYDRMSENGMATVNETYVVDALSYTEAETFITEETAPLVSGEFNIKNITQTTYKEIVFTDGAADDKWYKAKLQFIIFDEKTEKEKRSNVYYLVQAADLQGAVRNIEEFMGSSVITYSICSVAETSIMEVYEHHAKLPEKEDKPEYEQ